MTQPMSRHRHVSAIPTIPTIPALLLSLLAGLSACGGESTSGARGTEAPLVFLDSVRLEESDAVLVAKPNAIAVGRDGAVFIADIGERRVLRVDRDGRNLQVIAGTGSGPGEVSAPSALTIVGDTTLVVGGGGKRLLMFDVVSGTYRSTRAITFPGGSFGTSPDAVLMNALLPDSGTSFVSLVLTDSLPSRGGSVPAPYRENPLLAQAFNNMALAHEGADVIGIIEGSNVLYRWRGRQVIDSIVVQPVARRGARPDYMLELLRDPTKAPTRLFQWSFPLLAAPITNQRTAIVFFEPTLKGRDYTGPYYLQITDWRNHRACEEVKLPVPEDTPARFAMRGDTLTAIVQHPSEGESGSTSLLRWRIGHTPCTAS